MSIGKFSLTINVMVDSSERAIIAEFGVNEADRLGGGMEASVYALDAQRVLKIYGATTGGDQLHVLKDFYDGLDRSTVPFALPQLYELHDVRGRWVTVEARLAGQLLATLLGQVTGVQRQAFMRKYLLALAALSQVRMAYPADRYRLYDSEQLSRADRGDWHQFLHRFVRHKVAEIAHYLQRDVVDFGAKLTQLLAILEQPYWGEYRLIHGDFFPGNLLCDANGDISAVLDFGLFTMRGDWRYDLATACAFFDMYDELGCNARAHLFDLTGELFGFEQRGILYRYLLIFSLVGANAYSPTCADGHYEWCVQNLNNDRYWAEIE